MANDTINQHALAHQMQSIMDLYPKTNVYLRAVNGSAMRGFRIVEAVAAASTVHLSLVTTTGSVPVGMTLDHDTTVTYTLGMRRI